MGNFASHDLRSPSSSGGSRKVIFWDGTVEEFMEPLTVAELMMEHPKQVVVELQPDSINGKIKPRPLPADQNLDSNKLYLMVPVNKRGKPSTFSGEEARRLLMIAHTSLRARTGLGSSLVSSTQRFLPLLVRVCAGPGMAAATVSDRFTVRKKKGDGDDVVGEEGRVVVVQKWTPELEVPDECEGRPEFMSRKGWKPSLDTIVEIKEMEKRVPHWLFS